MVEEDICFSKFNPIPWDRKIMECAVKQLKIKTLCTIALSLSFGMNITFCKMNYEFGVILYNNTCI